MINKSSLLITGLLTILAFSECVLAKKTNVETTDLLVKFSAEATQNIELLSEVASKSSKIERLSDQWVRLQGPVSKLNDSALQALRNMEGVEYVQPNFKIYLPETYKIQDPLKRAALLKSKVFAEAPIVKPDNPAIPDEPQSSQGPDPLFNKQWGMQDIGVTSAWQDGLGKPEIIVAVIDTGVDYTHEDLLPNLWRNDKEIPNNNIDDDNNGYVDDIIGWDFVDKDNKPYDLAVSPKELLTGGGNPGHGTHCAGNVAAKGNNTLGIAGVAPNVKIMSLRFISSKGGGTTADAIKAIKYAVDNGAQITSNSWGSEGEDPSEAVENKALRDIIQYAQDRGSLFIAAAGNGHSGKGYDNDTDKAPAYPASYEHDIIISVAALDIKNQFGSFSNWGKKSVDIGAPGVDVFSTVVGGSYSNYVINMGGFEITWDGTSMATPHVAGAAALYWSAHPTKNWREVKEAILSSAKKMPHLENKLLSGGKLDVGALLK